MTRREELRQERNELIAEIQRIADGFGELARDTDRKMKSWDKTKQEQGMTRPEARGY